LFHYYLPIQFHAKKGFEIILNKESQHIFSFDYTIKTFGKYSKLLTHVLILTLWMDCFGDIISVNDI